jgi:hypothetical protein
MRRFAVLVLVLLAACSTKTPAPTPTTSQTPTPTRRNGDVSFTIRSGTKLVRSIRADMDGDGIDEVAVWSQAQAAPEGSTLRQSYVDVYSLHEGKTTKVFDAADSAVPVDPKYVNQQVQFFQFVTFAGKPDLVLGVLNQGASAGPLDIWVWSWGSPALKEEFRYSTTVDGNLSAAGDQLRLDTGSYKPADPMCCPSGMDHIVIGETQGKIGIVSKTTTKS